MEAATIHPTFGGTSDQQAVIGTSKSLQSFVVAASLTAWHYRLQVPLICGTGFWSLLLGPDNNWDLRFYHLYAPWAYLHGRYLYDVGPAQYQGFFNPTADFLFYALTSSLLNEAPRIVAFIMGAVHGINVVLILAIALHVLGPRQFGERFVLRTAAVVIGASGAGFVSLLGTTTNDLLNSIFVLGALLLLLNVADQTSKRGIWFDFTWPGLLLGIGVGLKYTAVIFIPGLCLIAVIVAARRKTASGLIVFGVATVLGFSAAAGHHLLTLWQDFGNPVFPLFNHIFQSAYYDPVSLRDEQYLPRSIWQAIAYPFYWTKANRGVVSELTFRDWRGAIAYVAIASGLLAIVVDRVRKTDRAESTFTETRNLGLVVIFVVASYIVWELGFSIYRYAVALEMLTGVVTIGALIRLFSDRRLRIVIAIVLSAIIVATTIPVDWGHGQYGDRYVDVRVPQLPANSVVLIASWDPVAYFIPFAEPTAQYLGIENNYLTLSQHNKLASKVNNLMRAPGRPKFVVSVGELDSAKLNKLLEHFDLQLGTLPCRPIHSNLEVEALSLCPVAAE